MSSVLAIVSKKVFEKQDAAELGSVYTTALYRSSHKALRQLSEDGDLYLVTVRPNERLWLVAVLRRPVRSDEGWLAENQTPMIDISDLRAQIKFDSGKGISQKTGALGMSLQTPRALNADDVALLERYVAEPGTASPAVAAQVIEASQSAFAESGSVEPKQERNPDVENAINDGGPEQPDPLGASRVIHYSEEARKHLWPRQARDVQTTKKPASRKKLWGQWHRENRSEVPFDPADSVGLEKQANAVAALFSSATPPDELDTELAAVLLASPLRGRPMSFVLAYLSPSQTLQALIASHAYHKGRQPLRLIEASADIIPRVHPELYRAYLIADEDTRSHYRAVAERAYETANLELRLSLLGCMQDRADWANDLARELLDLKEVPASCLGVVVDLLMFCVDDIALCERLLAVYVTHASVVNLVPTHQEKAVPILTTLLAKAEYPNEEKSVARALACIGTIQSANVLVSYLRRKNVRPYVAEFFSSYPDLAETALSDLAKKKTKVAGYAREILAKVARATGGTEPAQGSIASDDEVPEVLRNPPWRAGTRPKTKPAKKLQLKTLEEPAVWHWPELSRRAWCAERFHEAGIHDENRTKRFQEAVAGDESYFYANMPASVTLPLLANVPPNVHLMRGALDLVLGFEGPKALDAVLSAVRSTGKSLSPEVDLYIESPIIAESIARGGYEWGHGCRVWIEKFPRAAVIGIVPAAVASTDAAAKRAVQALRWLYRRGQSALIKEIARAYGPDAELAVDALMAQDPRYDCPKKPPKMPPFYRPAELRPPKLLNGKALPVWAVERLGEMLRFSSPHFPYVGLDEVRAACDPRSLAEHAWDIAQAWDSAGGKDTHDWMLNAVFHFGDNEVVRRLTPALRGAGIAQMLGRIGTDAACAELNTIIDRVANLKMIPKYAYRAADALRLVAAARGVPRDVLADSLHPSCGVDTKGGVTLDLGGCVCRGSFDSHLQPFLQDTEGNRIRSFPRKAKESHPAKYAAAALLWTDTKEDVATLAADRAAALERAMIDGRTWLFHENAEKNCPGFRAGHACFFSVWLRHPLIRIFARSTVWEALDPEGVPLWRFRAADDGTFADSHDEPCVPLSGSCSIRVAHPSRWDRAETERWSAIFTDYELLSPFGQFERRRETLIEPGVTTLRGAQPTDGKAWLHSLRVAGWARPRFARGFANGLFLTLQIDKKQVVIDAYRNGRSCAFDENEPVVLSEAMRLLR